MLKKCDTNPQALGRKPSYEPGGSLLEGAGRHLLQSSMPHHERGRSVRACAPPSSMPARFHGCHLSRLCSLKQRLITMCVMRTSSHLGGPPCRWSTTSSPDRVPCPAPPQTHCLHWHGDSNTIRLASQKPLHAMEGFRGRYSCLAPVTLTNSQHACCPCNAFTADRVDPYKVSVSGA